MRHQVKLREFPSTNQEWASNYEYDYAMRTNSPRTTVRPLRVIRCRQGNWSNTEGPFQDEAFPALGPFYWMPRSFAQRASVVKITPHKTSCISRITSVNLTPPSFNTRNQIETLLT